MPLLGQFMTFSGAVFVDRGNNAKAIRSLAAAGEAMRERATSLWLFPEGTRSMREHHDMLPFKKGAFHLAVQAGVPIVPVICENYWRLYRKGVFESGTLKIKGARQTLFRSCPRARAQVLDFSPSPLFRVSPHHEPSRRSDVSRPFLIRARCLTDVWRGIIFCFSFYIASATPRAHDRAYRRGRR